MISINIKTLLRKFMSFHRLSGFELTVLVYIKLIGILCRCYPLSHVYYNVFRI